METLPPVKPPKPPYMDDQAVELAVLVDPVCSTLPTYFLDSSGAPDEPKLLLAVNAFYDIVAPMIERTQRLDLVDSIISAGWTSANQALNVRYGKDLSCVEGEFMDDTSLRMVINNFYRNLFSTRANETREVNVNLVRKDGWCIINERLRAKYGKDLTSAIVRSASVAYGAPLSEADMNLNQTISSSNYVEYGRSMKNYVVSKQTGLALLTCGILPSCTVTDVALKSTFSTGFGCFELACYQDNQHVGKLSMRYAGDGTCVQVPTMLNNSGQIIARCYLASKIIDCCGSSLVFLLDIVGYTVLKASVSPMSCGQFTFYDEAGRIALECYDGICGAGATIRAREDIPFYAVALVPWKTANQR